MLPWRSTRQQSTRVSGDCSNALLGGELIQCADRNDLDDRSDHMKAAKVSAFPCSKVHTKPGLTKGRGQTAYGVIAYAVVAADRPEPAFNTEEQRGSIDADLPTRARTQRLTQRTGARDASEKESGAKQANRLHVWHNRRRVTT